jgi:hypothetical protein
MDYLAFLSGPRNPDESLAQTATRTPDSSSALREGPFSKLNDEEGSPSFYSFHRQ